jgi:hypothetical protein
MGLHQHENHLSTLHNCLGEGLNERQHTHASYNVTKQARDWFLLSWRIDVHDDHMEHSINRINRDVYVFTRLQSLYDHVTHNSHFQPIAKILSQPLVVLCCGVVYPC